MIPRPIPIAAPVINPRMVTLVTDGVHPANRKPATAIHKVQTAMRMFIGALRWLGPRNGHRDPHTLHGITAGPNGQMASPIFGGQLLSRSSQHSVDSIHSPTYKCTKKDSSHNYAINLPFIGVAMSPHDSSYILGSEKRPRCRSEALVKPSLALRWKARLLHCIRKQPGWTG
jgi:hypothetical protein